MYLQIFNTQNYPCRYLFQNLSLGFILKIFLKFRKFQPRYSYKNIIIFLKKKTVNRNKRDTISVTSGTYIEGGFGQNFVGHGNNYSIISCYSNRPFPSCLLPLFQNESKCETIQMKMSLIYMKINTQVKLIFI